MKLPFIQDTAFGRPQRAKSCRRGRGESAILKAVSDHLVINEIYLSLQGESSFAGWPCIFVRLTGCNLRCSYCDTAYAFAEGRQMTLAEIMARVRELAGGFATSPIGLRLPLVELTGGEPLLQKNSLPLMSALCDAGLTVLLETSGAMDIAPVDGRVHRIVDLKCPSSGECARNRWENLAHLKGGHGWLMRGRMREWETSSPRPLLHKGVEERENTGKVSLHEPAVEGGDEIKFVIGTAQDYEWARDIIAQRRLAGICPILFSSVWPLLPHQQDPSLRPAPQGQTPLSRLELAERIVADALPVRFQLQMHKFIWPPDQKGV